MISRRFQISLLLIFLSTIVLVVVLQYNANKNIDELVAGNESLLTEISMKTRLQGLQNDLLSIDNNVRSSIISNDPSRLAGIEEEVARVKASVKELGELLETDSSRRLWDELNFLAEEKIKFSYKVLDTLSVNGKQSAEDLIKTNKGAQLSKAIEAISTRLDNARQNYLTQLIKETDANSLQAKRFGLVMALIAIAIFLFTFWYIINKVRQQQQFITQLNESERKVREAAKIKEHFIANMSHEIRTPMNAILGFTNLLMKQPLENVPKKYVQAIESSSENLLKIINDVLDLSKIESGMMRIEKSPFSIRSLLHSVLAMFLSKAEEKKLQLSGKVDDTIPDTLTGDAVRITQVLVNLVNNAIKFTNKGSVSINISAKEQDTEKVLLQITVADTGIGIAKDQIAHVFERFTQAEENTTRRYGGTGLGLSIVQQLVDLLNGKVSLISEPDKGSCFTIELPFEIAKEELLQNVSPHQTPGSLTQINQRSILVVEDNPMNQYLMQHLFNEWKLNYDIAGNGRDAIEVLKKKTYDLILMDIQMPEMDGYTATQLIRRDLKLDTPIIAMTAHAFAGEREKCISYGMNEYISKPVKENDLYRMIGEFTGLNEYVSDQPVDKSVNLLFPTIDLTYLNELSGGNKEFEKSIMQQFIEQVPAELNLLQQAYDDKNWQQLKNTAHNLTTTVSFLGLSHRLSSDLEQLQKRNESFAPDEQIKTHIETVSSVCINAVEEARSFLHTA